MKRKTLLFAFCLCLLAPAVSAQVSLTTQDRSLQLFDRGKEAFVNGNYVQSADLLQAFERIVPAEAPGREEAACMLAVSAYERDLPDALARMEVFVKRYPASAECDRMRFRIANWYFFHEAYGKAIEAYLAFDMERLDTPDQEHYCYRLGLSYLKENRIPEAKPFFIVLTTLGDRYREAALFYNAYIAYAEQDYKLALAGFRKVEKHPEFSLPARYYITQIDFLQERYREVVDRVQVLLREPYSPEFTTELYRLAGESWYALGNDAKTVEWLSRYESEASAPLPVSLYKLGVASFRLGDYPGAIARLSRTTGGDETLAQSSYLYLGLGYLKNGDKKNAQLAFEMASRSDRDPQVQECALYNYALSVHETSFSPFSESVVIFEKLLNKFPDSRYADPVNDYLVEVYLNAKNYRVALESINKIRRPDAKILGAKQRILFQLGTEAFANSDFREAKQLFSDAILVGNYAPDVKAQAYFWRAECEYRSENYSQAVSDYRTYLSTTPQKSGNLYGLAQYDLAYAYYKLNNFTDANRWFLRYVETSQGADPRMAADAYNRVGDGYFYGRNFAEAESYYAKAAAQSPSSADYALFQKGFVAGLRKDYRGKIAVMDELIARYPQSEYVDDALFEKGRTYVLLEESPQAAAAFTRLQQQFPQSAVARKAGIQLGLLYFDQNELDKAIAAYKQVIAAYPGSEEARVAAQDLKSVYLEKNDVAGYAQYVNSLGGTVRFAAGEQDSLTFLAAEKLYMRNRHDEAETSLTRYLQSFEKPAFSTEANYYLAAIYTGRGLDDRALEQYEKVLQVPNSKFEEEALLQAAELYARKKDYATALTRYTTLEARTQRADNRLTARLGVLRATQALQRPEEVIPAANQLLSDAKLSPEWVAEARFARAAALQALQRSEEASVDWAELAKEPRNAYGAEAAYRLAQYRFDAGKDAQAEQVVTAFVEAGTPHQYWLARGFVLLSDIYEKRGDRFQAKQYLQSLKNNYTGDDDIAEMITVRMNRMGE